MVAAATLTYAALATSAIGAGVSAYGAIQSANAQSKAATYQAGVARNNALIAKQNAENDIQAGNAQASNRLMQSGQQVAAVRAAAAANGMDANSGTPLDLQSDTAKLGELDALTIRANAEQKAYGDQVQGVSDIAQSQLSTAAAANDSSAGMISATNSLLSGASSVSSKWSQYLLKTANNQGGTGLLT